MARVMLLLVLAAVLLSYLGPGVKYLQAWRLSRAESAEIQQLRGDNVELQARARRLQDPRHLELEARKLGMARPGERAYVVKNLPPD